MSKKSVALFVFVLALGILACYVSAKAQDTLNSQPLDTIQSIEIGRVLWVVSPKDVPKIYEVWKSQCPPPPANIYVHDTLFEVPGGYSTVRPNIPPIPYRDTLYQLLDGSFSNVKPVPIPISIFTTQTLPSVNQNDGKGISVGVKFRSATAGFIRGVRFLKLVENNSTHTGELYSLTGVKLASGVYTNETASGWQTLMFTNPIPITANTIYIATCFNPNGYYAGTTNGFASSIINNGLTGLADGISGVNGLYDYGSTPIFPKSSYQKTNYWVDVIFTIN